jgi:hypothetical protein
MFRRKGAAGRRGSSSLFYAAIVPTKDPEISEGKVAVLHHLIMSKG